MNKLFLGHNIRQKRLSLGIKQEILAKESQMTQSNLSQIEQGKIFPCLEKLQKIAEILETSIENLNAPTKRNQILSTSEKHEEKLHEDTFKQLIDAKDEIIKSQIQIIELLKIELVRLKNLK